MYRIILFVAFSFSTLFSFAQINFEKGYFIDNNGNKIECFIKNSDWVKNPTKFEYKINLTDESSFGTIETVQEFGVYNFSKYVSQNVDIDRSSPMDLRFGGVRNVSSNREPEWKRETLFLKVLIEGKASLYYFEDELYLRFFYKIDNDSVIQLINKEYSIDQTYLKVNKSYQEQLQQNLNCSNTSDYIFTKINYSKNELEKFFKKYNSCFESNISNSKVFTKSKGQFKFKPLIGYSTSKIDAIYTASYYNTQTMFSKSANSLKIGLQVEYVMDFNRNKWALLFEPSFESTKANGRYKTQNITPTIDYGEGEINFNTLDIGIGVRHYMYLTKQSSFFFSLIFLPKFDMNSKVILSNYTSKVDNKYIDLASGIGFKIQKFSGEVRYRTSNSKIYSQDGFATSLAETQKNNQINLILTYTLFQTKK